LPALIVSYSAGPGGAERILADHASALGDDTCVACPEGWLAEAVRAQGLRVFPLKERPLELRGQAPAAALRLAGHRREVRRLVENLGPRVVVAWNMRSLLACTGLDVPVVFQHNDLLPGPAIARLVRAAARRCEKVIALSQAIADDLGMGEVIHPGVDLERFTPTPRGDGALFLGVDRPWKRLDLARDACRIAGVPLTVPSGFEDPLPLLADAGVLIHAADREPFGLALVEALACDVPVVAPAAGGPLEIVDESSGRLYPPGDAEAAAEAIRAVLADAELRPRERAEREFDLRDSRRRWAEAIGTAPPPARGDGMALVTVLHDSESEVRALMASIDRHLPGARLIAADSGSSDGGAEAVRAWGGTVIDMGGNVGFGRATNAGVAAVDEPVTVVVNPDVELLDSSLARQVPEDRILAPLIVQPDGGREFSAHGEPPEARLVVAPPPRPRRRRVAWAVGACLIARTEVFRRLGPFDERTFLYGEDLDLGLRASDAGVETWFEPSMRVLHRRAHSTKKEFGGEAFELLAERRAEVVREHRGPAVARLDAIAQALTFGTRIAAKSLLRRPNEREREQLRAVRARRAR
jgi:N-acetylglucosaminyl-diphospho-decaprenol L-rhamnosyltransferase